MMSGQGDGADHSRVLAEFRGDDKLLWMGG
jgi:hypothetical protein